MPSDSFLRCHRSAMGHAWDDFTGLGYPPSEFGQNQWYRCVRCGTVKRLVLSRFTGEELAGPRYFHPEGYSRRQDEMPSRQEIRLMEMKSQAKRLKEDKAAAKAAAKQQVAAGTSS